MKNEESRLIRRKSRAERIFETYTRPIPDGTAVAQPRKRREIDKSMFVSFLDEPTKELAHKKT